MVIILAEDTSNLEGVYSVNKECLINQISLWLVEDVILEFNITNFYTFLGFINMQATGSLFCKVEIID